jgi:hypothetical protein
MTPESSELSIFNRCFGLSDRSILAPSSLTSPSPVEPATIPQILFPSSGWGEPSIFAPSEPSLLSGIFSPSPAPPRSQPTYLTSLWPIVVSSLTPLYTKSRIFVSYHHRLDQSYYDSLSRSVSVDYEVLYDNSPERAKDSDDAEYIMRNLRENHIAGSSCTIVLCGEETRWRRYVDWEIEATLDKNHGLIGVLLPTCRFGPNGGAHKPDRLQDNIDSGYAVLINWQDIVQGGPINEPETGDRSIIYGLKTAQAEAGSPTSQRVCDGSFAFDFI